MTSMCLYIFFTKVFILCDVTDYNSLQIMSYFINSIKYIMLTFNKYLTSSSILESHRKKNPTVDWGEIIRM